MRRVTWTFAWVAGAAACIGIAAVARPARTVEGPAPDADPVIKEMARLVGGRWVAKMGPKHDFIAEGTAEWTAHGHGLRWMGTIGVGRPDSIQTTSMFGVDPVNKTVYYIDFHGHDTVYKGTTRLDGDKLVQEFETIVGPPSRWKAELTFPDKETLHSDMWAWKDGAWVPGGHGGITFKRDPSGAK